jgi:hypothetical protein
MTEPRDQERTLAEHRAFYKAIMNRDADLACSRATVHISGTSHGWAPPWPTNTARKLALTTSDSADLAAGQLGGVR